VWDGKQLVPTTGPDGNPFARPGIIVYDADDMSTLSKHTTIPEEDLNKGYAGGGIWSTPVVDEETGYAYAGTANPASKQLEHAYDNAIVKIDLRGRPATNPTFGRVVGSYKGIPDSPEGTTNTAACDLFGDTLENPSWSVTCVQYDIDFAASPILYRRSSTGRTTVAESQKASVLHAVDAETMEPIWTYRMGPTIGYFAGGAGSSSTPAFDGQRFFINNPYTGVEAIGADTGVKIWTFAGEAGGRLHARPVSVANGVVYVVGQSSEIFALDAETGTPLWVSQAHKDAISAGAGPTQCTPSGPLGGGGTAIAHGTFLVNCDGALLAYRVQS
jgi:polyvinyl alcohol dehydrogenase (cytochrome)